MRPYSKELRQEVLAAREAGEETRAVALRFRVSESWVRRVNQQFREEGKTAPILTRRRVPKWHAEAERIKAAIERQPDLTLKELKAELGTELSVQTLCRALQKLRLHIKKKF